MLRSVWDRAASMLARGSEALIDSRLFPPISARALATGLGGGLLAHMVFGLTDAVTLGAKPGVLFWMLLGLVVALESRAGSDLAAGAIQLGPIRVDEPMRVNSEPAASVMAK